MPAVAGASGQAACPASSRRVNRRRLRSPSGRSGRRHQPGLVGEHHGLHPVAQAQLAEERGRRACSRCSRRAPARRRSRRWRARGRGAAARPARGGVSEGRGPRGRRKRGGGRAAWAKALDQAPGDRRRQQGVAGRRHPDRVEQAVGGRVLQQEAARPDPQGLVDVLVAVKGREHQRRRWGRPGRPGSARAADRPSSSGMRMSMSTTSGRRRRTTLTAALAVGGLPDHAHVRLAVQDHPEAGAQQPLVVGDHHRDLAARRGLRRRRASLSSSARQRTSATATRSGRPAACSDPAGWNQAGPPADPRSGRPRPLRRSTPGAASSRRGRRATLDRRAVQVVAVGDGGSPAASPMRAGAPGSAPVVARCMSTAQRTAAPALGERHGEPAPARRRTSRPPCSAATARRVAKPARRACGRWPRRRAAPAGWPGVLRGRRQSNSPSRTDRPRRQQSSPGPRGAASPPWMRGGRGTFTPPDDAAGAWPGESRLHHRSCALPLLERRSSAP